MPKKETSKQTKSEIYQVTARKWRPKDFSELRGQEHIANTLRNIIDSGKIAHAYLFSGTRGIGKTTTARILAKCLNCVEGPTMTPCSKCNNCLEIENGISTDVIEIDGASNRGVDRIRELRENVRYMPSKSRYKIYIIDEVHMLTTEAFNALLKTLEEPPEHVIFIFATTEPHKVKVTIRSRCQHFYFRRMNLDTLMSQVKLILDSYKIKSDEASIEIIARAADGSMRDSQSIMDQVIAYCGNNIKIEDVRKILGVSGDEVYYEFVKYLINKNIAALIKLIDDIVMGGNDLSTFSIKLMETFRNLTIVKTLPSESPAILDISNEQINELKKLATDFNEYHLREITRRIIQLNKEIRNTSNQRFLFESFIFNIIDYDNFISFADVLSRIEKIETEIADIEEGEITISDEFVIDVLSKVQGISEHSSNHNSSEQANLISSNKTKITKTPIDQEHTTKSSKKITKTSNKIGKKTANFNNYMSLIAEDLKNKKQMFTSEFFMKAKNTTFDDKGKILKLFYDDVLAFERCQRDIKLIEGCCKDIFGDSYKVKLAMVEKSKYTKEDYITNKKNIEELFEGEELSDTT